MTTEKLKLANELASKIKFLTDHIPSTEADLRTLLAQPVQSLPYQLLLPISHTVHTGLFSHLLPIPQDPKTLLELYLANARAELTRLQTEFDNL